LALTVETRRSHNFALFLRPKAGILSVKGMFAKHVLELVRNPLMVLSTASGVRPIVSFLVVAVVYWLSLWRIIKGNRGNRVIECGSIALMLLFLMMLLMKLTNLADWVLPSLGLLLFLLCLLTMFFLLLQGVHAIRHRKSKTRAPSSIPDE
jgi:hypothetical protein